jgi:hypothetical protein
VPDNGSAELKHVAPVSVFGCILHLYFSTVQHNGMNQNKNLTLLFAAVLFEAFYQVPELKSS